MVVDRAAKKAGSGQELASLLGAEIESAKDRERFLASFAKLLR